MKIDVSKIDGFEAMNDAEKLQALLNFDMSVPDTNGEISNLKQMLSKANSEAKNYKDQLRSKQTEQEQAEAARAEEDQRIREELATLRREKTVSGYKSKYLELGYDAELAGHTAELLADGKFDEVFANQKKFIDNAKQAYEAEMLNKQPNITSGTPLTSNDVRSAEEAKMRKWVGLPD